MIDAEESETERAESLANALAARDSFITAVGHELRNSVAPLLLLAEQFEAMSRPSPEQLTPKLATLTRNLRKFVATVDRVTEVAQLRSGSFRLDLSSVDLAALVGDVTSQLRRLAAANDVELIVQTPGPLCGRWDRTQLRQIVANLVHNAIRFGVGGEVEVVVRESGRNRAELCVLDHGPGIAPHELVGIFERFDHQRTRPAGGFGVGLFVVKTLVAAMAGTVTASNASGGGALFTVVLPRG